MHGTVLRIARSGHPPAQLQIDGELFAEPADAGREIDLTALFVLPGLADCHAHLAADSLREVDENGDITPIRSRAFAQLQAGVFLVIDKGWRDEVVLSLLSDPPPDRPHVEAAARIISGPHGYFPGFADETDEAGLVDTVRAANTTGGWVKVIGDWPQKGRGPVINFGEEVLAAAVSVAHEAGARVAIHAMAPDTPSWAVRAGVDSIEHGLYLKPEDLEALGARGGAWVPTIGNTLDVIERLGPGSSGARILGQGLENVHRLLQAAVEAGVSVLAGTDLGLAHGEVAREAAYLNRYGLRGPAAVDSAGPAAYRYLVIPHLEPGASADLLLFDEDPTADVAVLGRPLAGIRAGKVVFDRTNQLAPLGS
jgi:imidazolonepropionase-like amidohydrolase